MKISFEIARDLLIRSTLDFIHDERLKIHNSSIMTKYEGDMLAFY